MDAVRCDRLVLPVLTALVGGVPVGGFAQPAEMGKMGSQRQLQESSDDSGLVLPCALFCMEPTPTLVLLLSAADVFSVLLCTMCSVLVTVGFVLFIAVALACGKRAENRRLDAQLEMQSVGMVLRPAAMEQQNALQMQRMQQGQVTGHVVAVNANTTAGQPPAAGVVKGVIVNNDVRVAERTVAP